MKAVEHGKLKLFRTFGDPAVLLEGQTAAFISKKSSPRMTRITGFRISSFHTGSDSRDME